MTMISCIQRSSSFLQHRQAVFGAMSSCFHGYSTSSPFSHPICKRLRSSISRTEVEESNTGNSLVATQACKNMVNILGVSDENVRAALSSREWIKSRQFINWRKYREYWEPECRDIQETYRDYWDPKRVVQTWDDVKRGSDLFVNGLGKFNIPATYDKLREKRLRGFWKDILSLFKKEDLSKIHMAYMLLQRDTTLSSKEGRRQQQAPSKIKKKDLIREILRVWSSQTNVALCEVINFQELSIMKNRRWLQLHDTLGKRIDLKKNKDLVHKLIWSQGVFLISPVELELEGYFGDTLEGHYDGTSLLRCILSQPDDCPSRQHLIRYSSKWKENLGSIDELERISDDGAWVPENFMKMNPNQFLNPLRKEADRKAMEELRENSVEYEYLSDLPDSGLLRVLRSSFDVAMAARDLRNCANSYAWNVENEQCVLVALDDEKKPKRAVALGMIWLDDDPHSEKKVVWKKWSQIYLANNNPAPKEVRQSFYEYGKTIRKWAKTYVSKKHDPESSFFWWSP